jgi:two-component system LytT family response regulator
VSGAPATRPAAIRALVVDDEPLARRNLILLLQRDPDVGAVVECASGVEAVETIRRWKPDLVFLDVQMPECDGFDVLELLGADLPPVLIFVTAYDEHALRAFDAGALDYLLKPFDDARFARALDRAKGRLASDRPPAPSAKRLAVKNLGEVLFIDVADIDWIEGASYYACLHVGRATHLIRRTLSELERDLADGPFLRIHRSTIVNVDRIRSLELQEAGEYEVVLDSAVRLRLSRRFRKALHDRLGLRLGGR